MKSPAGWVYTFLGAALVVGPLACSSTPQVDNNSGTTNGNDGGASGSGGSRGNYSEACLELFEDDCGRSCSNDEPCPDGMHCSNGNCTAACGKGFPCTGGRECLDDGVCKDDITLPVPTDCEPKSCEELGFECGTAIDNCGNLRDCEEEDGLSCGSGKQCQALPIEDDDTKTTIIKNKCVTGGLDCEVCEDIPDCSDAPQLTTISGRVVTPGRDDEDTANQIGVPNAVVYILRDAHLDNLPAIETGIPGNGTSCDRCEDQDLGPVLAGAVSDAKGHFEIASSNIPVGRDILMVVKAGKFRRATTIKVADACEDNPLPETVADNPARLPRHMTDGLAVNIPHVAVATGSIDAMECVFHKMGIVSDEFTHPAGEGRIHLYRSNGGWPAEAASCASCTTSACAACESAGGSQSIRANCEGCANCTGGGGGGSCTACRAGVLATCEEELATCEEQLAACQDELALSGLVGDDGRITEYDLSVLDCEGQGWNLNSGGSSQNIREYVNRGGRLFASHLSFKWLRAEKDPDGVLEYDEDNAIATSMGPAAEWVTSAMTSPNSGPGRLSFDRDNASSRIGEFAEWMINEGIIENEEDSFNVVEPRSQVASSETASGLGPSSEEFVYCESGSGGCTNQRTQQFSFNTPYGAPEAEVCGRVAYSGFHVAAAEGNLSLGSSVFPGYCTNAAANDGVLTDQEKILLYMLFDLGACVGEPLVTPPCVPSTCPEEACGYHLDGCGEVLNCGDCDDIIH